MQLQWRYLRRQGKKPDPEAILIHSCTIPFILCSGKGRTMGQRTEWELAGDGVAEEIYDKEAAGGSFEGVHGTDLGLNHGSAMTPNICQKSEWSNTGKNFTVYKIKKKYDIKTLLST